MKNVTNIPNPCVTNPFVTNWTEGSTHTHTCGLLLLDSPGPGLWSLVLGPFGPDLGPDLDLTWDLDLDLSLTIFSLDADC